MFGLVFLLGLAVGSFANVLIDRLPRQESIAFGRSRCDWCKKSLRWFELIPVVSFLIQAGRCRRCRHPLSLQYPLVETVTGLGFVILYQLFSFSPVQLLAQTIIFVSLLVIFLADLKYQIVPDAMVVSGLVGGFLQVLASGVNVLPQHLAAGAGASLFFYFLYRATRARGMGLGDVKLVFLLGFLSGFPLIILVLYAAFLTGAATGVILILKGKKSLKSKIAFGPFLVTGFLVAMIWGNQITAWWRHLL